MIGHKLGEFAGTRTFKGHTGDKKRRNNKMAIEVSAVLKGVRISPQKARLVVDSIRGKKSG